MNGRFNLSDWALSHRSFVWYLMIVSMLAGAMAYVTIGRREDPDFTIKTMVVSAALPGASMQETLDQVTSRIEKKLEEVDELDFTRSITRPGQAIVYVNLLPTTRGRQVRKVWQRVRNMLNDIRADFPPEFAGFSFNDRFGDVFGNLYAFQGDGYSPRALRDLAESVRRDVQQLDDAGKVKVFGARKEVIYLDFKPAKLATLGLTQRQVEATLAAQNAIVPSGVIEAGNERVVVRVGGRFRNAADIAAVNLHVGGRFVPLAKVAEIRRAYKDPPKEVFRYDGAPAVGLAVGMRKGGDILRFGRALDELLARERARMPVGVTISKVADQPAVVHEAVGHFTRALFEAVAIVMIVSFISVGLRAGLVVALAVPLVLAITFVVMKATGFTLQRVSLGALIIALGLLVDDAMIAVESMIYRLERGDNRRAAASYAWRTIAFPMLSGTLVTVSGFIPIGLNNSAAGEFTFSLFVVIAVSLLVSWGVAVLYSPVLGATMLPRSLAHDEARPGLARRLFRGVLRLAMRARWLVIALTLAAFAASIWGMRFVEMQFFPSSDRPELLVDFTLPQNATIAATRDAVLRMERHLGGRPEVRYWTSYIGRSAPRFLLPMDVHAPEPNFGEIVIQTRGLAARERLRVELKRIAAEEFSGFDVLVKPLAIGPPVGRPVAYRLSGPDVNTVRDLGRRLEAVVASDRRLEAITLDWNAPARVVRIDILQDKARKLGLSSRDIAAGLALVYDGQRMTRLRDGTYLIDVTARAARSDRTSLAPLYNLQINTGRGLGIPLSTVATFHFETEQPVVVQRNRMPTITVKAAIATSDEAATIVKARAPKIAAFRRSLPPGYRLALGGAVEKSAQSQAPIAAAAPLMIVIIVTLVMMQLQSFRLALIALSVAPLGLVGVVVALLAAHAPLGFVAILGVLALGGILIRNSIILIDRIEALSAREMDGWQAVFEATDSRARPIFLTAAAASLALIPISWQVFWGPMAYALMGGIIAGTVITLLFVPALYLVIFRVPRPRKPAKAGDRTKVS